MMMLFYSNFKKNNIISTTVEHIWGALFRIDIE
jgi:hypothetical protein